MDLEYLAGGADVPEPAKGLKISGLTADSRKVEPGFLFAALKGAATDGTLFAPGAVEAGAVAVLCALDAEQQVRAAVPENVAVLPDRSDSFPGAKRSTGAPPAPLSGARPPDRPAGWWIDRGWSRKKLESALLHTAHRHLGHPLPAYPLRGERSRGALRLLVVAS